MSIKYQVVRKMLRWLILLIIIQFSRSSRRNGIARARHSHCGWGRSFPEPIHGFRNHWLGTGHTRDILGTLANSISGFITSSRSSFVKKTNHRLSPNSRIFRQMWTHCTSSVVAAAISALKRSNSCKRRVDVNIFREGGVNRVCTIYEVISDRWRNIRDTKISAISPNSAAPTSRKETLVRGSCQCLQMQLQIRH